ncbi:MAG TPA: exodeoxyribonuclease VII small subunit [Candidatus Nitrosopolaris sp.]|nr:exodeoxyribonuclease VII small subunit [Candidatus Nitrosopolaris sp.]
MAKKSTGGKSYAQLSAELGEVMDWFEGGEVDLDEALAKYQQATKLIEQMENYLKTAANKIKKINKV